MEELFSLSVWVLEVHQIQGWAKVKFTVVTM